MHRGQRLVSGVFLGHSPPHVLRQEISPSPELTNLARLGWPWDVLIPYPGTALQCPEYRSVLLTQPLAMGGRDPNSGPYACTGSTHSQGLPSPEGPRKPLSHLPRDIRVKETIVRIITEFSLKADTKKNSHENM